MDTLKLLWFFLWRASLMSLGVGALGGAVYGVSILVGGAMFSDGSGEFSMASAVAYMLGMGIFFGVLGMVAGLVLGFLNGLLLFAMTRTFYHPQSADADSYHKVAGWACAATSVLVLVVDWAMRGFPDPDSFILLKSPYELMYQYDSLDVTASNLAIVVALPMLLFALVMWWVGGRVAGQYTKKFQ